MGADQERLLALAEAIADGRSVDWASTERTLEDAEDREMVRQLRLLAGVAEVHRPGAYDAGTQVPPRWGALAIIERVGFGSFGSVYRARDPRLNREVALKLLHRDAGDDRASLLIEEGRLLASVRHPHVITVFGADRVDGTAGIWMEFIEGRTLEQILRTIGPFSPREAALIGVDLCGALAAVHAEGLLHRDLKAQNVMRQAGGRIVLMDFGAGREQAAASDPRLVGTPAYMAPEVLRGEPATIRSDIYSLGVLLFRLTTGTYPVPGRTVDALLEAHEAGRRSRLGDLIPDVPRPFAEAVERAIAREAAARFASAGEMSHALSAALVPGGPRGSGWRLPGRTAVIGFVLVAMVGALAFAGRSWSRNTPAGVVSAPGSFRSLAVRPLRDLAPSPERAYFASGLTDILLAHLGAIGALKVVEATADADDEALGRMGVEGVLEGSVLRERGRVWLSTRVVEAGTGTVLWGKVYEKDETEAFSLQAEMAIDLARDLHVPVSAVESRRLTRRYVMNGEAQDRHLRGRYLLDSHTRDNLLQARTEFETAVRLEPEYAPALASLALTYLAQGNIGVLSPAEVRELAPPPADQAYAIDPMLAEAALAVADIRFRLHWDWEGAEQAYRHAIALNPSNVEARGNYARFLAAAGRTDDAMREAREAYHIDPLSIDIHSVVGMMLYYDRRFDEAVEHFESRLSEPSGRSHIGVGRAASAAGRHAEAIPALRKAAELSGQQPSVRAELARALAAAGHRDESVAILRDLEQERARAVEYIAPHDLAYVYIALGQHDVAFELLDQAVDEHASRLLWIGVDPRVDPVRADPRLAAFLGRLKARR